MNTSFAENLLARAREEFKKLEAQAKDSEKRKELAQNLSREAKQKFKQAKKWARQTKKLLKKAKGEAEEKLVVLQHAMARLKKVEERAVKEWNQTGGKAKPKAAKAKPAKTAKPAARLKAPAKPAAPAKPVKSTLVPKPKPAAKKKIVKPAKKPSTPIAPSPAAVIVENDATAVSDTVVPSTSPAIS
jgi:hypothetical protein